MSKWISVDDALPEVGEPILCVGTRDDGGILAPLVAVLHDDGKFITGYRFAGDRVIGFFVETFATHWMPLPELPGVEV